jgi:hypothetical protein
MKPHLILITFLAGLATAKAEDLFANPLELFRAALMPALTCTERAKVETTWRGFFLRADSQSAMELGIEPSECGIYLDVAVRDAVEIPLAEDSTRKDGGVTRRTVKFPAGGENREQGLLVTLVYGGLANAEALKAIEASIAEIQRRAEREPERDGRP